MPKVAARNARLALGARDFSGQSNNMTLDITMETPEVTTFLSTTKERLPGGITDVELNADIFFMTGASEADADLYTLTGCNLQTGFYPEGFSASSNGYEFGGVLTKYNTKFATNDAAAGSLTVSGSLFVYKVDSLFGGSAAGAATVCPPSVDFAGSSASRYVFFRVFEVGGTTPTLSVCAQSASVDTANSWVTMTGASIAVAPSNLGPTLGFYTPYATFSCSRYMRIMYTLAGTSPSAKFMVSTGSAP